jgi:hypothetical protein
LFLPKPVGGKRRQEAVNELSAHCDNVCAALLAYLQSTGEDRDLQTRVLKAFNSWARGGGLSPQALSSTPLLPASFEAAAVDELFEVSMDTIIELVRHTDTNSGEYHGVSGVMLPRIIGT